MMAAAAIWVFSFTFSNFICSALQTGWNSNDCTTCRLSDAAEGPDAADVTIEDECIIFAVSPPGEGSARCMARFGHSS